jgi:succinoglycan biosynthesis transport protein ExoP
VTTGFAARIEPTEIGIHHVANGKPLKNNASSFGWSLSDRGFGPVSEPHSAAGSAETDSLASGFDLATYWRLAVKWRLLILILTAACLAIGLAVTMLTPPIYRASSVIQIDRETPQVFRDGVPTGDRGGSSLEFLSTQYGLLHSRSLAERVVNSLDLANSDTFLEQMGQPAAKSAGADTPDAVNRRRDRATRIVMANLDVAPVSNSRLVRVSFKSPSPQLSAQLANAISENFIQANLDHKFESSAYVREFLEKQIEETKQKLEDTERELVAYASGQQIINITEPNSDTQGQSLTTTNLIALNNSLVEARSRRVSAEEKWRQAQSAAVMSIPEVVDSAPIQTMIAERARLDGQYREQLEIYKPDYPAMQQLRAQIDGIDRQIASLGSNIKQSIRNQFVIAANEERSLQAQVDGLTGNVLDLRQRSIQYNILQRELDTSRELYDGLLQRYKEVGVTGGVTTNNIAIIDRAQAPGRPSSPNLLINLAIALFVGLGLGALSAFILEALDESLATPEDVETKVGVPVLGVIPKLGDGINPIVALDDIRSGFSEAYYALRTALQFSTPQGAPASILITSSRPGEGKSTTAFAVAHNLARVGRRVLLVDGDLRRPSLHRVVGGTNNVGVSNFLSGSDGLADKVQPTSHPNLAFIACGPIPPNPAELWGGDRATAFVQEALTQFDHVIIDGPPVLGFADAPILAAQVTGFLFVAESRGARRSQVRGALRRLASGHARLLGVVLTKFNARAATSYGGYDYAYDYDYAADSTARPGDKGRRAPR